VLCSSKGPVLGDESLRETTSPGLEAQASTTLKDSLSISSCLGQVVDRDLAEM